MRARLSVLRNIENFLRMLSMISSEMVDLDALLSFQEVSMMVGREVDKARVEYIYHKTCHINVIF